MNGGSKGKGKSSLPPPARGGKARRKKPPAAVPTGAAEGIRRKGRGVMRVLFNQPAAVIEYQLRLLENIHAHGSATTDDGESRELRHAKFTHTGARGAAVAGLVAASVIVATGKRTRSERPFRHGGELRVWQAKDPVALPGVIADLKTQLAALLQAGGAA